MFEQEFSETKLRASFQHRNSFDAGYESLLSQSSFVCNQSRIESSIFSAPSTPVKHQQIQVNCNQSSTSPDLKQQYVADVNSIYFASLRNESFLSPIKGLTMRSPLKSPKLDQYVQQRDNFASKLLRSPAFKPSNIISPGDQCQPQIKSFAARFESCYSVSPFTTPDRFVRPSPTEEEFMELLIKNKHLPRNPENLIGRNMGLDHFDILTGLAEKSMFTLTDKILTYMQTSDLVRVASVSRSWRAIVKQNESLNKHRVDYLKSKKYIFEKYKENRPFSCGDVGPTKSRLSAEQKRRLLKDYRLHNSLSINENEQDGLVKHESGSYVFASLDNNCLNNISNGGCREEDFKFQKKRASVDVQESPNKRKKPIEQNKLNNELFNACNSLFDCINRNQQVVPQRPNLLEKEFQQISLEPTGINDALMVVQSSPLKRRSPLKRQISVDSARCTQICSKKSKRNLKRL